MVDDDMIGEILDAEQVAAMCSRRLMDAALSAGGRDNVTAVVARVRITAAN
jgi:serine/threonine protein phosphatase PrpC